MTSSTGGLKTPTQPTRPSAVETAIAAIEATLDAHTHVEADVTGLVADLAAKQPVDATLTALAGLNATAGLVEQTGADTFTKRALGVAASTSVPTRADADSRYAATSHTHAESDITNLVSDLAGKAAASHTHAQADVTNLVSDLAAKVPTSRTVTALSPLTGGGALSGDISIDLDETVAIGNNARVAVSKNSGATVGTRRRINFIQGSNVTLTIADDAGNEEVDVTIAASGGSASLTATTINIPSPVPEYTATVTDAGISGSSKIMLSPGHYADTDANMPTDCTAFVVAPAAGSFTVRLQAQAGELIYGDYKYFYMAA